MRLELKALATTFITAFIVTLLLSQRHMGFAVAFEVMILLPWLAWSAWIMATQRARRRVQAAKSLIWVASVALIVGIHAWRAHQTREDAQRVVDAVLAYRAAHGAYPQSTEAIGYTKDQLKSMIGFGGYFVESGKPFFFYASTYVPFETEHYDFETNTWTHLD